MELSIKSGTLTISPTSIDPAFSTIESLIGFASRQNEKRGFLFVSKVLGKHIPVKPSVMRATYDLVAEKINVIDGSTLFIGMAETATGLGGGVADSYARMNSGTEVVYQHTTRHFLDAEETLRISEAHSHAVSHILYEPLPDLKPVYQRAEHLVVVDDEISTGNTLINLIEASLTHIRSFRKVTVVALVSWLDSAKRERFLTLMSDYCAEQGIAMPEFEFVSLFEGKFEFVPDQHFKAQLPHDVDKEICKKPCLDTVGRQGCRMPMELQPSDESLVEAIYDQAEGDEIAIIGTGEHLFLPFLVAEQIEQQGGQVVFQSTTRSPVIVDGKTIANASEITIDRDGQAYRHYIYNHSRDRRNFVVVETPENAAEYQDIGVAV